MDFIETLVRNAGGNPRSLSVDATPFSGFGWIAFQGARRLPEQGWKLHLSATTSNASVTLERVIPLLVRRGAAFKVVRRIGDLALLNAGDVGVSQMGKFVTVYPEDDAEAAVLAAELHDATPGLGGPVIPSDHQYKPGSAVWFRYGAFGSTFLQLANGEVLPAIRRPDGGFEPDRRGTRPRTPGWVGSPFPVVTEHGIEPRFLVGGRFVLTGTIAVSPSAHVLAAVDLDEGQPCVVKRRDQTAPGSANAEHEFAVEARMLSSLKAISGVPRVLDVVSEGGHDYLFLSNAGRTTLLDWMTAEHKGVKDLQSILPKARDVARTLAAMHRLGVMHGDVKTTNIMVDANGRANLIDFHTAVGPDHRRETTGHTPGYVTRERSQGGALSVRDDIHGLGAVLYALATGAEPSYAPDTHKLLTRPPRLLNPACSRHVERIIERALSEDHVAGYAAMSEVVQDLARIGTIATPAFGDAPRTEHGSPQWALGAAKRLARSLMASARRTMDGAGVVWQEPHPVSHGGPVRDLQLGTAGIVLALAELYDALPGMNLEPLLRAASRQLSSSVYLPGGPLPGLMVGEAGVGVALMRSGYVLEDANLVSAGAERVASTAQLPHRSPDFFNGSAGRLLAHLIAWDATEDDGHREAAEIAGDALITTMVTGAQGGYWTIPEGFEERSGSNYLGYAHGAAGIADALLMLYEETSDRRFRDSARRAAKWIARHSVPSPSGRVDWPTTPGEPPYWPVWCHGSAGIGQFLVRAVRCDLIPEAGRLLHGAAIAAARGARMTPPVQCHGLAGNIEFLLDVFELTGDSCYLHEAESLGDLLAGWELQDADGTVFRSDTGGVVSPSYWIGYSGVATCLLRMAEVGDGPRQLSRQGFRRKRQIGITNQDGLAASRTVLEARSL